MLKSTINGIEYDNYGTNNYSCEMEAVIFNPKDITPKEINQINGFFLHPTMRPNSLEIFALKGTINNFESFKSSAIESHCTKLAVAKYGLDFSDEDINQQRRTMIDDLIENFVIWE